MDRIVQYTEEERKIFSYPSPDGTKTLYEDPLRLRRDLLLYSQNQFNKWLSDLKDEDEIAEASGPLQDQYILSNLSNMSKILNAARQALKAPPIDQETGEGLTDEYILSIVEKFVEFVNKKKGTSENAAT